MSSLLDCPNEVLEFVIEEVSNGDIESFSSSCRIFHTLSRRVLTEHRKRKDIYASITYGNPEISQNDTTWPHPTLMLRDLLYNDSLCYPRILYLNDNGYHNEGWYESRDSGPSGHCDGHGRFQGYSDSSDDESYDSDGDSCCSIVEQTLATFYRNLEALCKSSQYLNRNGNDRHIRQCILGGQIGATLGLLLTLLPNLEAIQITEFGVNLEGLENLTTVIRNVVTTRCSDLGISKSPAPPGKLQSITFPENNHRHYLSSRRWHLEPYAPFFFLPSMRTFQAQHCRAISGTWNFPGLHSHVEELSFKDSDLNLPGFEAYLRATKNLRLFRYTNYRALTTTRPLALVRTLLEVASHSFCRLEITTEPRSKVPAYKISKERDYIGSLQGFQILKHITIVTSMLVGPIDAGVSRDSEYRSDPVSKRAGSVRKLVNILPASAESLVLDVGSKAEIMIAALEGLREGKVKGRLFHHAITLTRIHVSYLLHVIQWLLLREVILM